MHYANNFDGLTDATVKYDIAAVSDASRLSSSRVDKLLPCYCARYKLFELFVQSVDKAVGCRPTVVGDV